MRVGVIAPPWVSVPPSSYGGTESVVDTLTRALVRAGHDVALFATGDSTNPFLRDFAVARAPGVDVGGSSLEFDHILQAYAALGDCDIVHDHTMLGPVFGPEISMSPIVTTNHNPFVGHFASLLRRVAQHVPIIAISQHHASTAGDIPIGAVIHHGIEPGDFAVGKGDGGFALFLGRMSEGKGAHRAIRIARQADIPLVLAGKMQTHAEQTYFREQVEPLLGEGARYVGEVDNPTKLKLLADAVCLLNPIVWPEPFGLVMIESLACGTPVIALSNGAATEIVDHLTTGFLGTHEDDLVAGLAHVTTIDRWACRAAVEERFSADRMASEHIVLYERLIAEHDRTSIRPS